MNYKTYFKYIYVMLGMTLSIKALDITDEMRKEILSDFSFNGGKQITSAMISSEGIVNDIGIGICEIENNTPTITFKNPHPLFEARRIAFIRAINDLSNMRKLPNIKFIISFWDEPKEAKHTPVFGITKDSNENIVRIPLYNFILNGDGLFNTISRYNLKNEWQNKINKMCWRSQLTGAVDLDNLILNPRFKLCQISLLHPNVLDAKLTGIPYGGEIEKNIRAKHANIISKNIREVDFLKYKYLPLIDGFACPTATYWMLFANSLIFKVNSKSNFHFTTSLKPFVHYIPIKEDMSDLFEQYKWAEEHQDKSIQIIKNANNFAKRNLSQKSLYAYLSTVIDEYSKIYKK